MQRERGQTSPPSSPLPSIELKWNRIGLVYNARPKTQQKRIAAFDILVNFVVLLASFVLLVGYFFLIIKSINK
jgi:hypothetical protein